MSALTHLYLNNNKLINFDCLCIIDGLSIKYLNLGNNSLYDDEYLDLKQYDFESITSLNLDGNKFKKISMRGYLTHLERVKEVSMANNLLTLIESDYFDPLTNLEVLNLAFNNISYIRKAFYNMRKLKTLILSHNSLSEFDNFDFPSPSSLQYLAIDYNQLVLMPNIMEHTGSLKKIAIDGNPWSCKCLKQYRKVFHDRNIQEVCADDVKHACMTNIHSNNNNCYIDVFSAAQIKIVNLVTPNSTYYCVLNEFDQ
uniref:SLIT and NTRK-like protein 4 n=1 Tax=Diabrotica virgifera virgifera TaxID=50390 RepID=A0A6P7HI89_DIAVI